MTNEEKEEVREVVNNALDHAESVWGKVGEMIRAAQFSKSEGVLMENAERETQIPGYEQILDDTPAVDDFIAIVADIASTTSRLRSEISAKVSRLKRVYYETSAVLPAIAKIISQGNGSVTEYLGDGVLGLFQTSLDSLRDDTLACRTVGLNCFSCVDTIINPILNERYSLPALTIKIGMSFSQAIVTTVGIRGEYVQPKAIGECVYYASKQMERGPAIGGHKRIYIDPEMYRVIPKSKDGSGFKSGKIKIGDRDVYWIQ